MKLVLSLLAPVVCVAFGGMQDACDAALNTLVTNDQMAADEDMSRVALYADNYVWKDDGVERPGAREVNTNATTLTETYKFLKLSNFQRKDFECEEHPDGSTTYSIFVNSDVDVPSQDYKLVGRWKKIEGKQNADHQIELENWIDNGVDMTEFWGKIRAARNLHYCGDVTKNRPC